MLNEFKLSWLKRHNALVVVGGLILGSVSLVSPGSTTAATASFDEERNLAQAVADYHDVSITAAGNILDQEDRLTGLSEKLEADGLGGDGFYIEDSAVLVVNATPANFEAASAWVADLIDSGEASSTEMRVQPVSNGLANLEADGVKVDKISEKYPDAITSSVPNVTTDRLDVTVYTLSEDVSAARTELEKIDSVNILETETPMKLLADTIALMGYQHRYVSATTGKTAVCSMAFPLTDSTNGDDFMLTAGHCLYRRRGQNVNTYMSPPHNIGNVQQIHFDGIDGDLRDYGFIKLNDNYDALTYYNFKGYKTEITATGLVVVGQTVCQVGGTTGNGTGTICGKVTTGHDPDTRRFRSDMCTLPGDSGAPIVNSYGTTAIGMTTGIHTNYFEQCVSTEHESIGRILQENPDLEFTN